MNDRVITDSQKKGLINRHKLSSSRLYNYHHAKWYLAWDLKTALHVSKHAGPNFAFLILKFIYLVVLIVIEGFPSAKKGSKKQSVLISPIRKVTKP